MKDLNISDTYAKILFKNALDKKANLRDLSKILGNMVDILNESKYLGRFLTSPISDEKSKFKIIEDILKKLGKSELISRFIHVLVKNNKIGILPQIYINFEQLAYESEKIIPASLTIAKDLSKKEFDKCVLDLEKKLGKKFLMKKNIDPSIIGGMVLKFGSNMYDFSIESLHRRLG
jgi:F-type H+-transporting ATPase subunit delta